MTSPNRRNSAALQCLPVDRVPHRPRSVRFQPLPWGSVARPRANHLHGIQPSVAERGSGSREAPRLSCVTLNDAVGGLTAAQGVGPIVQQIVQ